MVLFIHVCMNEQVTSADLAVVEGQEVTMSVLVCGQPKPMVYW